MTNPIMQGGPITGDGDSAPVSAPYDPHRSAPFTFYAVGSFGGGTLKVETSPDGKTWIDVTSVSLTSNGYKTFTIAATQFRVNMNGSTTPSVNWWII